jgi:hypothetical protein
MLVFRLTDENVRRVRGKESVPIIPPSVTIAKELSGVTSAASEWMARYESYSQHQAKLFMRAQTDDPMSDERFARLIDETMARADAITAESLV